MLSLSKEEDVDARVFFSSNFDREEISENKK
jgi:hypothetical protein